MFDGVRLHVGSVALFLSWPALVGATREHPRVAKRLDFFFTLVAFVRAVMWMDAAAGELVALFGAIGRISGVSESLLGATVFAWGISVSDLVSDTTVARRGWRARARRASAARCSTCWWASAIARVRHGEPRNDSGHPRGQ